MVAAARMLTSVVHIKINGSYLADEQMRRISEVVVEQSLHLPDMAVLRLHDVGDDTNPGRTTYFKTVDRGPFNIGDALEIAMGREETPTTVFKGEITAIEIDVNLNHPPLITVRGYSRAHRLHRGRFCRSFTNESDSGIVAKIAREMGLQPEVEETTPKHKYVYQNNQTNWEFLKERAALNGFELFIEDRTLHFRAPKNGQNRGPEPRLWENLLSLRIKETSAWQVGQVTVRAWDPQNKQPIVGTASRGRLEPAAGIGKSGAQVAATFGNAAIYVVNRPVASQEEANKLAQAVLDELDGSFIQAEGICLGDPAIKPGISLPLQTLGATFSGTYYVTAATHMINAQEGYTTSFVVSGRQTNSLLDLVQTGSGRDSAASVVIGIVTDNNDPAGQGRVLVKFPWLSADDNSAWARVASPMAGNGRGIYFLPEINDEVLVAFEHGDMARPFVIGALWNGKDAPPQPNSKVVSKDKVNQRIIKTRAGHVITLDDTEGAETISIVDKTGNNLIKIESASNKITIKANGDIAIESQGTTSVTAQQNVTVEAQMSATVKAKKDVNVQATGNASVQTDGTLDLKAKVVNVEAQGTMTLKANGSLTIQGAQVNIN